MIKHVIYVQFDNTHLSRASFGTQEINPLLTGSDAGVALTDLLFPGFDGMSAAVSLAYVAAMQEHGIPVTFAFISDAHDNHATGQAFGPGQQGYTAQLAAYDQAFANFFARLASDGIDQSNTLFVFTVDEGDHFVGVAPQPPTCDGTSGNFCNYPAPGDGGTGIWEIDLNIDLLFATQQPALAAQFVMGNKTNPGAPYDFTVHGDDAPTLYLSRVVAGDGGQTTGALGQTDQVTRHDDQERARCRGVRVDADRHVGRDELDLAGAIDPQRVQRTAVVSSRTTGHSWSSTTWSDFSWWSERPHRQAASRARRSEMEK